MALEPITRKEKIIAGEDLQPITRLEKFLKQFGGGGGGGSVPKPLTYDYMPEGYPKKTMGTVTVMEEQELAFAAAGSLYFAALTSLLDIVGGQTYTVKWDGTEHECVCSIFNGKVLTLGNLSIIGMGSDTGEPFCYASSEGGFATLDTSASHTISVKRTEEIVTPMAEEFLPVSAGQLIVVVYNADAAGTKFAADKTYEEISAAIESGMSVVIHRKNNISSDTYEVFHHNETGRGFYKFCRVKFGNIIEVRNIGIRMVDGKMVIDIQSKEIQVVTS